MRILCVLLLVLPLLFPGPCAEGVRRGLALAAGSALPALFPFFVAGELLTVSHADRALSRLLAPLLRRIYALPQAGAAPVVLGLTGGYPVGAAVCASLLREGPPRTPGARRCSARAQVPASASRLPASRCSVRRKPARCSTAYRPSPPC